MTVLGWFSKDQTPVVAGRGTWYLRYFAMIPALVKTGYAVRTPLLLVLKLDSQ